MLGDAAQTVVAGQSATRLDLQDARFEVEFIVYHDDLLGGFDAISAHHGRHGPARLVHERDRERQDGTFRVEPHAESGLTDQRVVAPGLERRIVAFGE